MSKGTRPDFQIDEFCKVIMISKNEPLDRNPFCKKVHQKLRRQVKVMRIFAVLMDMENVLFSILKSTLIAIRGVRGKQRMGDVPIIKISMNLIPEPEKSAYEV